MQAHVSTSSENARSFKKTNECDVEEVDLLLIVYEIEGPVLSRFLFTSTRYNTALTP